MPIKLGFRDKLWHCVRLFVLYKFHHAIKSKISGVKFATILAFLGVVICGKVINRIVDYILDKVKGYKALEGIDELFLYDSDDHPSNVITSFTADKFDFETMKSYILKEFENTPRA